MSKNNKDKEDKSKKASGHKSDTKTKVYFDGDCPMCRTFIPWLDDNKSSDSVKFENLRTEKLPEKISKEQASEKIHLVDKNGKILTGAKAVFATLEQNKKLPILVKFGRLPIISNIAEVVYSFIANNRFLIFGELTRAYLIKLVLCLALVIPLIITKNLWLENCLYPFTPLFDFLPLPPTWLNIASFLALLALSALIFIKKEPKLYIYALLTLLAVLSIFNISRAQPYNYQFFFMFLALSSFNWLEHTNKEQQKKVLSSIAIILIGIWFWSGVHKLNLKFFTIGYPWLISVFPDFLKPLLGLLGLFTSVVEAGGAICLLFKKTRKLGVIMLSLMHAFLLLVILLHNNNHSVISWNIAQVIFLYLVFWNSEIEIKLFNKKNLIYKILFILMPFFSYFNLWNDSLSFKLYSWNYIEGEILATNQSMSKELPKEISKSLINSSNTDSNKKIIPIQNWSYQATNSSPFYSEKVYKNAFKEICKINNNFLLNISQRAEINSIKSKQKTYSCNEIRLK